MRAQNTFAALPVGTLSAEQAVTVTSAAGGAISSVEVLTAGNPAGDFAVGTGPSTCSGPLAGGGTCTESVTFKPSVPGVRTGAVVLLNASHQVLGTAFVSGIGLGGLGVLVPGNMITVAGLSGTYTGLGDGGAATAASLNLPASIAFDGAGNMYIADSLHNRVRMVCGASTTATIAGTTCATAGIISTVAGTDAPAHTGDGGPAAAASLNMPTSIAIDGAGNLYIADTGNNVVRMVSVVTGDISTVAGGAAAVCAASSDAVGDGCPADQAKLNAPWGVTIDAAGNLYIADTFDQRIREVSAATGTIATVAGTGFTQADGSGGYNGDNIAATAAELNFPFAVAFDPQGNMYIPDSGNQRVREVLAVGGAITPASQMVTLAGTGKPNNSPPCFYPGTPAANTQLSWPEGVASDAAGNVYIADTQNEAILKVNPTTHSSAPLAQEGCTSEYNGGLFIGASLYGPMGLYVDGSGNVFVADYYNMVVQEVQSNFAAINDIDPANPTAQGSVSAPRLQDVENEGNAPLNLTALTAGTNTAIDAGVTQACTIGNLPADADCNIGVEFAPAANPVLLSNQNESGTVTASEETLPSMPAPNNPLAVEIFGTAAPGSGTVTQLGSYPNPSTYGQKVTLTVTVTAGRGIPGGAVTIFDTYNGATSTLAVLVLSTSTTQSATATFQTMGLAVGAHSLVASYAGDSTHGASKSTDNGGRPVIQIVQAGSATALTAAPNPSIEGTPVTLTAVVTSMPAGYKPQGTVKFTEGNTLLGSAALATVGSAQQASIVTSALPNGPNMITASYPGDPGSGVQGSTSNTVVQDVQAPAALTLSASLNPVYYQHNVIFSATVTSKATKAATGTVLFFDDGVQIGSALLSGNPAVARFATSTLGLGTHPITATYAGDAYNTAAQAGTLNELVTLEAFTLSVTPSALSMKASMNQTVTVAVTSVGGYSDTISFGCSSLPTLVHCSFSPISVKLPPSGTATTQLNIDTNNPLDGGASAMNQPPGSHPLLFAGLLLPFGSLCFFVPRRRGLGWLSILVAIAISAAMLLPTGCGGISLSSATPGSYTIQVSGTAATSYFTRDENVKLTITP